MTRRREGVRRRTVRAVHRATPKLHLAVVAGAVVMTAGRVIDLRWHATHEEFETGADQVQAYWLAWIGTLVMIAAAAAGLRRASRSLAIVVVLGAGCVYAVVAVWQFWLHNELRDPALPHVLLALTQLALYVGAAMVAITRVRTSRRAEPDPVLGTPR